MNLKNELKCSYWQKSVTLKWKKQILHRIVELIAHEIRHNLTANTFESGPMPTP